MASAIFGVLKYLPASLARKALAKANPGFENYFSKALSYGVDANRALDYLIDKFENSAQKDFKQQQESRAAEGTLRPDEMATRSQVANAAIPGKILKGGASALLGGALGIGSERRPSQEQEPTLTDEEKRQATLQAFNERLRSKKPKSELSREELTRQFEESQQGGQGKAALLSTMQQLTEALRQMRGQGG